jgi:hypothetical protein
MTLQISQEIQIIILITVTKVIKLWEEFLTPTLPHISLYIKQLEHTGLQFMTNLNAKFL